MFQEIDFITPIINSKLDHLTCTWSAPSNIALVKYWGKKENQLPANPSLSFTLNNCKTITTVDFKLKSNPNQNCEFELFF